MNTIFDGYGPYKGDLQYRNLGSLIAFESGESVAYGLFNAQDRGTLFIGREKRSTPEWSSARAPSRRISS